MATTRADKEAQIKELEAAVAAGWELHVEVAPILARYRDRDIADRVPRAIIYHDIGILAGTITYLEMQLRRRMQ